MVVCWTVKQWGLSRKVPTSVEYNVQLNISVIKGLYGNIIPSTAPNHPMANNALIFFSTNTMKIQNMQGTVSDFWWLMIGMYSGEVAPLAIRESPCQYLFPIPIGKLQA